MFPTNSRCRTADWGSGAGLASQNTAGTENGPGHNTLYKRPQDTSSNLAILCLWTSMCPKATISMVVVQGAVQMYPPVLNQSMLHQITKL